MKKVIFACCFVLGTALAFGQGEKDKKEKSPEKRAEMQTARLDKAVQLSQEQRSKIYEINLSADKKNMEVRKTGSLTQDQAREKIKANNEERKKLIAAELSDEQKTKLKAHKKEKREKISDDDGF